MWNSGPTRRPASPSKRQPRRIRLVRDSIPRCHYSGQRSGCAAGTRTRAVIKMIRRARRVLPGDPEFGDPLSTAGDGGPRAAARAAGRLLGERGGASREVGLGALQVWQALTEAVSRRPANPEVTLVFTDLVGFSTWSLQAGDDATLKLLAAGGAGGRTAAAGCRRAHRQADGRRHHGGVRRPAGRRRARCSPPSGH